MAAQEEWIAGISVEIVLGLLAGGLLYRAWGRMLLPVPQRILVQAFQQAVILRAGKVQRIAGPGTCWIMPQSTYALCDMRLRPFQVHGQELMSSDGVGVRVSLGGEYRVDDPSRFVAESSDPFGTVYLDIRQALRSAVGENEVASLLEGRALLAERVKELVIPRAAQLGVEVTHWKPGRRFRWDGCTGSIARCRLSK